MNCLCRIGRMCRSRWGHIHLVDKCLLVILIILMLQSTLSLFHSKLLNEEGNAIDVVIRTSTASIFGYLISANFNQHRKRLRVAQRAQDAAAGNLSTPPPFGPRAQIGFQAGEEEPRRPAPPQVLEGGPGAAEENSDRAQILVVGTVGVLSLVVLVIYRNVGAMDVTAMPVLTQFRDFVSGSVGFLIGCSTRGVNSKGEG